MIHSYWQSTGMRVLTLVAGLASLSTATPSQAAGETEDLRIFGFMTMGAAATSTDTEYGPFSRRANFRDLSRVGLNLSRELRNGWEVATQFVVEDDALLWDWGFLAYRATKDLRLRFGRQKFAVWLISDYRGVGKLYPWVRPPEEVYGQLPIDAVDGGGLEYTFRFDELELILEAFGGGTRGNFTGNAPVEARDVGLVALSLVGERARLRAAHTRGKVDVQPDGLPLKNLTASFSSIGARVEAGSVLFMSEYSHVVSKASSSEIHAAADRAAVAVTRAEAAGAAAAGAAAGGDPLAAERARAAAEAAAAEAFQASAVAALLDGPLFSSRAYYATVGYQLRDLTPHFTFAALDAPSGTGFWGSQTAQTLGLRYDASLDVALKFDYSHIVPDPETGGVNRKPVDTTGARYQPVDLFSFAVDVVF